MASAKNDEKVSQSDALNRGGLWDRQVLLGGLRLTEVFNEGEDFILWDLEHVGVVDIGDGSQAEKTALTVSTLEKPGEKFTVGTLARAIHEMAVAERADGDLPAVVKWTRVETKRELQPAVVLIAVRQFSL